MIDEDPAPCPTCKQRFSPYETEDDPVVQCRFCKGWLHTDCLDRHWCEEQATVDGAKLRAWELACADGRQT